MIESQSQATIILSIVKRIDRDEFPPSHKSPHESEKNSDIKISINYNQTFGLSEKTNTFCDLPGSMTSSEASTPINVLFDPCGRCPIHLTVPVIT